MTALSPTPAGEGKTTTTVGLTDALHGLGHRAMACLREPSMGPVFGMKGGAAGGGYSQVVPMTDINLHFTGDFAAHRGGQQPAGGADRQPRAPGQRARHRRPQRHLEAGARHERPGAAPGRGRARRPRQRLPARGRLRHRRGLGADGDLLPHRVVGRPQEADRRHRHRLHAAMAPVTARQLGADGAMAVLLRDALAPNLVQTLEGAPAFVHGGPFANIAHGCSSVIATRAGLRLTDFVVTEAGFGADLGAEKFVDIKCRKSGLRPDAAVVVATVRALKYHGGVALADLDTEDVGALEAGMANLRRHLRQHPPRLRHPVRGRGQPVPHRHRGRDREGRRAGGGRGSARLPGHPLRRRRCRCARPRQGRPAGDRRALAVHLLLHLRGRPAARREGRPRSRPGCTARRW